MIKGLGVVTGIVLLSFTGTAFAATATTRSGDASPEIEFRAKPGEANDVRVSVRKKGRRVRIVDSNGKIRPKAGCRGGKKPGRPVLCTPPAVGADRTEGVAGYVTLRVTLGDGDDRLHTKALPRILRNAPGGRTGIDPNVDGGDGADTIETGATFDTITPGDGDDTVRAGRSADFLEAGRDPDGADLLDGGRGGDAAYYSHRSASVRLSADGAANDGAPGEGDQLLAVESLGGGAGDDVIAGNGGRNVLFAAGGADSLAGLGGRDVLYGDDLIPVRVDDSVEHARDAAGDDVVDGGGGRDVLTGGFGDDLMLGGPGPDVLDAQRGIFVPGEAGREVADLGTDRVECGPKRDAATLEKRDRHSSCEERTILG
jgi:Ca2+-binding RTX toxin-like protein